LVGRASSAGARLDSDPDPSSERRRDAALYVDEVIIPGCRPPAGISTSGWCFCLAPTALSR